MDGVYYRSDGLKMCLHVKEFVSMSWVETRKGVRMRTLVKSNREENYTYVLVKVRVYTLVIFKFEIVYLNKVYPLQFYPAIPTTTLLYPAPALQLTYPTLLKLATCILCYPAQLLTTNHPYFTETAPTHGIQISCTDMAQPFQPLSILIYLTLAHLL